MKTCRSILLGAILAFSTSTAVLGGDMQGPGQSNPSPPPPTSAIALPGGDNTEATNANDDTQILLQDIAAIVLSEVLLTVY